MAIQLGTSSAVIAAHHFNPSVMGEHWLVENKIVSPEELQAGRVFTDMFAQIPTPDFLLHIVPENCQFIFRPHVAVPKQQSLLTERLARMVELVPHTPYTAVGLNFVWHVFPKDETIGPMCRRLFFSAGKAPWQDFDQDGARFGGYMSMGWRNCRLRLDAKPLTISLPDGQQSEMIQFAFNYHRGVLGQPEPWREIVAAFDQWEPARDHSLSVVQNATGEKAT